MSMLKVVTVSNIQQEKPKNEYYPVKIAKVIRQKSDAKRRTLYNHLNRNAVKTLLGWILLEDMEPDDDLAIIEVLVPRDFLINELTRLLKKETDQIKQYKIKDMLEMIQT